MNKATFFSLVIVSLLVILVGSYIYYGHNVVQHMDNTTAEVSDKPVPKAEVRPDVVRGKTLVAPQQASAVPALDTPDEEDIFPYAGGNAKSNGTKQELSPEDLLPPSADEVNQFAVNSPSGASGNTAVSFLTPGFTMGINTTGGSRKNGSQDIRKPPPIPKVDMGPCNQSTRLPDLYRKAIDSDC